MQREKGYPFIIWNAQHLIKYLKVTEKLPDSPYLLEEQ